VSTPRDPEDEPTGAQDDLSGGVSADEAAWRSIIENYGERPDLADDEVEPRIPGSLRGAFPDEAPMGEPGRSELVEEPEDHYVPPTPPPLPRPEPPRLLAWLGLFGVPIFVLVCLLTRLDLPTWMGLLLMVWFVGGFVYLVASMRPSAGDDYDDGAVL
jgi:hypothetical protein